MIKLEKAVASVEELVAASGEKGTHHIVVHGKFDQGAVHQALAWAIPAR